MTAEEAIQALKMMNLVDVHPFLHLEEMLVVRDMAIAAPREQEERRWIPVTERLPKKATEYLCRCCIDEGDWYPFLMVLTYYPFDEKPHFQHEFEHGLRVTHWMPIPRYPHQAEQTTEPQKEDNDAKMQ